MLSEGRSAVELERAVDLEEMEMRTDLHRTVAGVAHLELRSPQDRREYGTAFGLHT